MIDNKNIDKYLTIIRRKNAFGTEIIPFIEVINNYKSDN